MFASERTSVRVASFREVKIDETMDELATGSDV